MKNILIVEDSKVVSSAIKNLIETELNYHCVICESKKESAQTLLKYKGKFDVALLDLGLPDAPNGEIVDFITKFNIPTIILTGSTLSEDETKFRNKNIVDYVIKDGSYSFVYAVSVIRRIINNAKIKVLIVDDSPVFIKKIEKLILRYKLISYTANNSEEALKVLKSNPDIKLVLTDYYMPIMNGLELTRKIRKKYTKDELGIIVLSDNDDKKASTKVLKYGANDFLDKKFSNDEFFARISANLEILELFEDANNKANRDFLTGMYNRRYLFQTGVQKYDKANKNNKNFAIVIIDIDKFKNINDTHGHDIGDIAIKEVAIILNKHFNDYDNLIARLGGEEFCILISKKKVDEVKEILEEVRKDFELNIIKVKNLEIKYTVSIGCSFNFGESMDEMIQSADNSLYVAKDNGRNQVRYRD